MRWLDEGGGMVPPDERGVAMFIGCLRKGCKCVSGCLKIFLNLKVEGEKKNHPESLILYFVEQN